MSFSRCYIHTGVVVAAVVVVVVVVDNAERRAGKFIDANFPAAVLRRRGKELLSCVPGLAPARRSLVLPCPRVCYLRGLFFLPGGAKAPF